MAVHLQGMGLIGSLVARSFAYHNIPFSWSDTESPYTAWHASTGAVYPTGQYLDQLALYEWQRGEDRLEIRSFTEAAAWCYTSKHPPEQGSKYGVYAVDQVGPIQISGSTTLQFNVQELVKATRTAFAPCRRSATDQDLIVVTHGSATAKHFVWGWSANVELEFSDELMSQFRGEMRPAIYMREGYDLAYLYPKPGSRLYYGGTSTIVQRTPKPKAEIGDLYKVWKDKVRTRTGGHVEVTRGKQLVEGWRPRPYDDAPWVKREGRNLFLKPMGGNGVRHFPLLVPHLLEAIGVS